MNTKHCSTVLLLLFLPVLMCFAQKQKDEPLSFQDDLSIRWDLSGDTIKLFAKNKLLTPLEVYFTSKASQVQLKSFVLPPKDSLALVSYSGPLPDTTFISNLSDSISLGYYFGHESVIKPDLDYEYRLPFKRGKKYEVTQSFNGKYSHSTVESKYAIDFRLEVGEIVYAAREGTVVKVIDWFTKKGGRELTKAANKIVIMHPDGTYGTYAHLTYKGAFVKEGEEAKRGQKIGVSGLTGHTRGPHLHFVVRKERDIAIPVYFKGYEGKVLKKGKRYKVKE